MDSPPDLYGKKIQIYPDGQKIDYYIFIFALYNGNIGLKMANKIRIYPDRNPYIYGKVGRIRIRIYVDAHPAISGYASRAVIIFVTV